MPQAKATKPFFSFVGGLITEANPLTYPEHSSIDEANFVLKKDGSRERRLGIDYEESYALSPNIAEDNFRDSAISVKEWRNVGNDGDVSFTVAQIGDTLHFYDASNLSLSSNKKGFTVDLNAYMAPQASNIGSSTIDVASANGKLFVVSADIEPIYVEYDRDTDTITTTQITIEVRDFEGADDGLTTIQRPRTLSAEHEYNLRNQGWSTAVHTSTALEDPIERTFLTLTGYPSNADIWWLAKDSDDKYEPLDLNKIELGNTPASKGHYIFDVFNKTRTNLPTVTEEGRPSTVEFMAGRIFYSGINSKVSAGEPNGSAVYYSQILDGSGKEGYCYQSADPASEEINDLIATDGGVIHIPEAGTIKKIVRIGSRLAVFASNGVWEISGDADTGFSATSQSVASITDVSVLGANTVVSVEGSLVFWSEGGIYVASPSEVTGKLQATNITERTIQTLYTDISSVAKTYASGVYDKASKQVVWLYNNDTDYDGTTYKYVYNKEIVFDLTLKAFSINTISSLDADSPQIVGNYSTSSVLQGSEEVEIVVGADIVAASAVKVVVSEAIPARGSISTKYLTVVPDGIGTYSTITFSSYRSRTFYDWNTSDGTGKSYSSFLITGYDLFGDLMRDKAIFNASFHFARTETGYTTAGGNTSEYDNPSSCFVQTRWDWSDSISSNKWSDPIQVYKLQKYYVPSGPTDSLDYGFTVVSTKNKLRGTGNAVSLYIYSEEGKDMKLLGWGLAVLGESVA